MSSADTQFSKVRLETLCDVIFAIAMTLLLQLPAPCESRPGYSDHSFSDVRIAPSLLDVDADRIRIAEPGRTGFYLGNQFMLATFLAAQWLMAKRQGLLIESDGSAKRRQFELMICAQPISFAAATAVVFFAPGQALFAAAMTQIAIGLSSRRLSARR